MVEGPLPIFFCRRWDRLTARLMALTNAMAVAQSFGAEFRFMWPVGTDPSLVDPTLLLGRRFSERFQIAEKDIRDRPVMFERDLVGLDRQEARSRLAGHDEQVFVEIKDPFDIVHFRDDDPVEAATRFRACFYAMEWSNEARRLLDVTTGWDATQDVSALHIRAGDIVFGDWRHTMYYAKYMPLAFVLNAIEQLSHGGEQRVLLISDNTALICWLRSRFPAVSTMTDIIPDYGALPEMLRAFADVLVLSRSGSIYGPSSSAFSSFAAHIGGHAVAPADRLVPRGGEAGVLYAGIRRLETEVDDFPFLGPLVAHDIIWYLDVFGDELTLGDQRDLARRAVALAPDFMGGHTRLGLATALIGDHREAAAAAETAVGIGRTVNGSPDAPFEAFATQVVVACFDLVLGRGHRGPFRRLFRRSTAARQRTAVIAALPSLRGTVHDLSDMELNELNRDAIVGLLGDLVGMVEWLSETDDTTFMALRRRCVSWEGSMVEIDRFREPTMGAHYGDIVFQALVRNFERAVVHLSQAVGFANQPVHLDEQAPVRGRADRTTESQTGMRWLEGWVVEQAEAQGRLIGGLALVSAAGFLGGAAASLTLPDFEAIVGPTGGAATGYRIPVPREVACQASLATGTTVLGISRDGRASRLDGG